MLNIVYIALPFPRIQIGSHTSLLPKSLLFPSSAPSQDVIRLEVNSVQISLLELGSHLA